MIYTSLLRTLTSALLLASCVLPGARAASEADVRLVYNTVRAKFADFNAYCQLEDAQRRQAVVQVTMTLASERKISDPFATGSQAGSLLRGDCGLLTATTPADAARVRWTTSAASLSFDSEQRSFGFFTTVASLGNRIYAPEGKGPFPAVVLNHTIGGLSQHLQVQAKLLLDAGFAVMVVDSYGPRNIRPGTILFPAEVARDAYDALAHLNKQPYIDRERIYQAGYSLGALASALLASSEGAQVFKSTARFRASVGHYGSCAVQDRPSSPRLEMLTADSDRPILMLMAELDIETPPQLCFPLLEQMKAAGKEVDWHIYPATTHGWDKAENNGYVYRAADGRTMTYRYDAQVSQDATQRMIAFFNRHR
jgi:dienelactone hydrolase